MKTFTLTYKEKITKSLALQSLSRREEMALDVDKLRSCCGSLAYLSLFLLPEYEREDKKVYSIENICTHVPGLFTLFMHEVLENLGRIASGEESHQALYNLLNCAGFYECFEMLGVTPKVWYRIFLYKYLEDSVSFEQLMGLQSYDALATLFYNKVGANI